MFIRQLVEDRSACAIIAFVDKRGRSSHAAIVQTIDALRKMGHRSGDINGEGDGCGICTDIPREIWSRRLAEKRMSPYLAESRSFFVGHFLLPADIKSEADHILARLRELFKEGDAGLLIDNTGSTRDEELGPRARKDAPLFWQVGGLIGTKDKQLATRQLFDLQLKIEQEFPRVHVSSLSLDSVIFKLQGVPDLLPRVFPELMDENFRSVMALGHGRYSTNTLPTVERTQPFSLLGHNGEINTIERLRFTGRALGIEPVPGGSDSQDLNRIIDGLVNLYGLDIIEAFEMVFPSIYSEVACYPPELQDVYTFYRWFFPSSAQGPAAVVSRFGDICLGSVDALGLRPLWFGESDYSYFLSSEKGVVDLEHTMHDPRPLGPGEKIAIYGGRGVRAEVIDYGSFQKRLVKLLQARPRTKRYFFSLYKELPARNIEDEKVERDPNGAMPSFNLLAAFGWRQYDIGIRKQVSHQGREVIGSLGYTGPLAAFAPESLPNISDYAKEMVAVVTNPAIDRERESEHFSLRTILGSRPDVSGDRPVPPLALELQSPLLIDKSSLAPFVEPDVCRKVSREFNTCLYEDVYDFFTGHGRDDSLICSLDSTFAVNGSLLDRLEELCIEAVDSVKKGAVLVVIDDTASFGDRRIFIDPALVLARLNETMVSHGIRREAGIIVRSGAIRNLHDIMFMLGLGADGLVPYLLYRVSCSHIDKDYSGETILRNNLAVLHKGMEKVMSTMGIHELCGYGRIFAAIGLTHEFAELLGIRNFCGAKNIGLDTAELERLAKERYQRANTTEELKIYREPARNPKIGKILRSVAQGNKDHIAMAALIAEIDASLPTGIRHLLGFKSWKKRRKISPDKVDISIGSHAMPLVIAAMSFGSQGENSFRTYADAARMANIICINGEGGEIPDMLGKYRKNRGQQLASGRFGVFMAFINSVDYLEIKIGQGAKPGEGGHLPGAKVTKMVASARHCKPGITLISPSNHHDIYSIEDLAQIITELKTANPHAKISVKVPITSGIGTIAVGIAKAGADIINLSGYEGGTGAARQHAKRFVGLPAEIGVSEAHRALLESCLRDSVELWVDGGMRSGADVLKMILLGANRVGFGTAALMAIGCISCESCHLDRCPRGISTQIGSKAEAEARGIKVFIPRALPDEAENLTRLLVNIGEELKMYVAALGQTDLQDLVGRTDLLEQVRFADRVSAADILAPPVHICDPDQYPMPQITRKPLNHLTRLISDLAMARFASGNNQMIFAGENVRSIDRAVGTYLAGAIERHYGSDSLHRATLRLSSSVPGNGLIAFNNQNVDVIVEGGSQDGAAKGSFGGFLAVLKGRNLVGRRIDGSTGKSFAYGAIGGMLIVQNMADSRACIRLSGADVIFGGRIVERVRDEEGNIACRAHLKGFAFEYMTGGRVVVLGDPGPWICAGMTGGVIYQCLYPELDFRSKTLKKRFAQGANVSLRKISKKGLADVRELLGRYIGELENNFQADEAAAVRHILDEAESRFVMIVPRPMRPVSAE